MEKTLEVRIKQKKDTHANLTIKNPLLLNGEAVYAVMDNGEVRQKVGDGTTRYTALPFIDDEVRISLDGHTHPNATQSAAGFMSSADKAKLDSIASGANSITVDSALSSTSTNPVQNKVINSALADKAASSHTHSAATTSVAGFMSASDKSKLDGIATGANNYTHPTTSGNKHIPSGGSSGQILRWSADGTAVWGADNNTTYSAATTSTAGLMSASDKSKLDGIASGANAYTLPTASSSTLGGVKVGSNITNSSGTISLTKTNVTTALGYTPPTTNTTYSVATTSANGLMSSSDKAKLDGIASGATKITVDSELSSTSTNPVQNKVVNAALANKANASHTHDDRYYTETEIDTKLASKSDTSHTHNYAGSSSAGGAATSANKLNTNAGDYNTPVYFSNGVPVACTSLDLNTTGSSASCTGNSATATKLQTARTISLSTGAEGTATSFNGTANISIPVTAVKEAYLSWGGTALSGSVSPIDVASSNIHSANRFAFAKAAGITIEYSTDGGSTYSTYSTTDSAKITLVSGLGSNYYIGGRTSSITTNDKLRITLNATNMGVYTLLRKLLINISTSGASGSNVIVERAMKGSESTYTTMGTYSLSGWSGWNSIPISYAFGGGSTQTVNVANLRLTFGITGVSTSYSSALNIKDIVGIGDTYWAYPSAMAKDGHLYSYDSSQNAIFPANVTASSFSGSLNGNATTATTATKLGSSTVGGTAKPIYLNGGTATACSSTVGSATQPVYMNGGTITACTYTLGKSVPSNAVFTDTTYSVATTSANGLMSASDKSKLNGIATGANNYTLPTASSSTLGGVKTTSTVTSTSGLTACPIISGVPYYKDTNTTYTLSSFGITATAAELNKLDGVTATTTEINYVDGVTSNIQTQLNALSARITALEKSIGFVATEADM